MKVSVILPNFNSFTVELNPGSTLQDLKHLAEAKSGIPSKDMILIHNGICLTNDERILEDLGVKDGYTVTAHKQENEADGNEQMETETSSQTAIQVSPILLQEQTGFTKKCEDAITLPQKQTSFTKKCEDTNTSPQEENRLRDTNETRRKKQATIWNQWKDAVQKFISPLWSQSTLRATVSNGNHPLVNPACQLGSPCDQDVYMINNDSYSTRHFRASMAGRNFHGPVDSLHASSFRQGHLYVVAPAGHNKKGNADPAQGLKFKDPAFVRELLLNTPDQLALVRQNNPQLAEALDTNRLDMFTMVRNSKRNFYIWQDLGKVGVLVWLLPHRYKNHSSF
uniref:Ubiquitin-like domain-containing protein n=1 Tax=Cacopsylla melanoneura TaxID=428564 RepID=A0A8D9BQ33_9HEMI